MSIADSDEGLVVTNLSGQKAKGKQRAADSATDLAVRLQFLVAYDMADWQDWKTYYSREDCLMRHREPHVPAGPRSRPQVAQQQQQQDGSDASEPQDKGKRPRHA